MLLHWLALRPQRNLKQEIDIQVTHVSFQHLMSFGCSAVCLTYIIIGINIGDNRSILILIVSPSPLLNSFEEAHLQLFPHERSQSLARSKYPFILTLIELNQMRERKSNDLLHKCDIERHCSSSLLIILRYRHPLLESSNAIQLDRRICLW